MVSLQGVAYTHPDRDVLFSDIHFTLNKHDKVALLGPNGAGKSTLLRLAAGDLLPSAGQVKSDSAVYYVPQHFGQFDGYSVAEALRVRDKLDALHEILDGRMTEANLALLDNDWTLAERCREALALWQLDEVDLDRPMHTLSGGQKTKVFLAGIYIHRPETVLLDEPSNHLDALTRDRLYTYIRSTAHTLWVVSHDRALLNLLHTVCELGPQGITVYGGNYDFYKAQKDAELGALEQSLKSKEKELRKARETEREAMERQQKLDARGKKKQEKAGLPTISMNTFRNRAEKSTAHMKGVHAEKTENLSMQLDQLRREQSDVGRIKIDIGHSSVHKGKVLAALRNVNVRLGERWLWQQPLSVEIRSGERVAVKGDNGSGKTTLLKLLLGQLTPSRGTVEPVNGSVVYVDQDYSLVDDTLSVYDQAQRFNTGALHEHEIKTCLNRFLFPKAYWDKPCSTLSGGEKMRLLLCLLTLGGQAPDLVVLDEPTNNLDIANTEMLSTAISGYRGTLIVVSHDEYFLQQVGVERVLQPE